jgi:hypothetical protein
LKTMPSFGYRHTIIIVHRSPLSFRSVVGCTQQSTRGVYRSNKHVMHCLGFLVQSGHAAGHPWFTTCSVKPTTRRRDNYRTPSINRSVSPPLPLLCRRKKCTRPVRGHLLPIPNERVLNPRLKLFGSYPGLKRTHATVVLQKRKQYSIIHSL